MREVNTIGRYLGNGSRAQVHTTIVGEGEGEGEERERIAVKFYREKAFCKQELEAYEHIRRNNPSTPLKLPQYFGPFRLTEPLLSSFYFELRNHQDKYNGHCTPYKVALGLEKFNGVGLDTVIDDLTPTFLGRLEEDLLKCIRALHDIGICHRDLKENNILLDTTSLEDTEQGIMNYRVIDLSDAVLKHKTSERCWTKWQKQDLFDIREMFSIARAVKAVELGFHTLSNILPPPSCPKLNQDVSEQSTIDVETQLELYRLLKVARSAPQILSLVNAILRVTTSLIPELCLAVVKILRGHGESRKALSLIEQQFAGEGNGKAMVEACSPTMDATSSPRGKCTNDENDSTNDPATQDRCPHLSRQKALILQDLGRQSTDTAQAFEFAIAAFCRRFGAGNEVAMATRREYALFRAGTGDRDGAIEILRDILGILESEDGDKRTRRRARFRKRCEMDLKHQEERKEVNSRYLATRNYDEVEVLSLKRKLLDGGDDNVDVRDSKRLEMVSRGGDGEGTETGKG